MTMNADVFFVMGRTHTVCQDYATVCGESTVALSDGCSSSKHTDFGARLLCRLAAMGEDPIAAARPLLAPLLLPSECLDATILTARETVGGVRASVEGDGIIVGRKRGGGYRLILSEYPSGAPRYPNYDADPSRRARYVYEYGNVRGIEKQQNFVHRITVIEDGVVVSVTDYPIEDAPSSPYEYLFETLDFDMVLLLSDGVMSFHRPVGTNGASENVPCIEVVLSMLAVQGFAGEFLVRRGRAFLKKAASMGWTHDDDFAAAAVYLGEISS